MMISAIGSLVLDAVDEYTNQVICAIPHRRIPKGQHAMMRHKPFHHVHIDDGTISHSHSRSVKRLEAWVEHFCSAYIALDMECVLRKYLVLTYPHLSKKRERQTWTKWESVKMNKLKRCK